MSTVSIKISSKSTDFFFELILLTLWEYFKFPSILDKLILLSSKEVSPLSNPKKASVDLDDIFIETVDKYYIELIGLNEFKRKYKSLTYEYEITKEGLRKYSVSEIVDFINKGKDKEKYLVILKNRINPNRHPECAQRDLDELNELYKAGKLNEDVAETLDIKTTRVIKGEFLKYLSYLDSHFDRITKSFAKKEDKTKKK